KEAGIDLKNAGGEIGRGIGDGGKMVGLATAGGALEFGRGSVEVAGGVCYVSIEAARFTGDVGLAAAGTGTLAAEVAVGGAVEAGYWAQYGARVGTAELLRGASHGAAAASTAISPNGTDVEVLTFKSPRDARKFVHQHPELLKTLDQDQMTRLTNY